MILCVQVFLASMLIALLFYRIEFKILVQKLISSYKKSGALVVQSGSGLSNENDLLMQEVKIQFSALGVLFFRFSVLLSPAFLLMGLMHLQDIPLHKLFGIAPLVISTMGFLIVYLFKRHAAKSTQ